MSFTTLVNNKQCVVSLGIDTNSDAVFQNFGKGLRRIEEDLATFGFGGAYLKWDQRYPESCPTHDESPFGYKSYCMDFAAKRGFGLVLWLDSSIRIRQPLEPIFKTIRDQGHIFFKEDHSLGAFCKDDCLDTLGISREESFSMPCCWACAIGLNLNNPRSAEFLRRWKSLASDGKTFRGPKWSGVNGQPRTASNDSRVMGHRHDQTAASAIALKLGMGGWKSKSFFGWFFENNRESVRKYTGD